jgi:predicted ATP-grasp superfamily ATP-dependent carboligase
MDAIILDGHLKGALASVRSLGKKNVRVICASDHKTAMALHSKYCSARIIYPSPMDDEQAFVESIIELAQNVGDKPLIYCFSDETFLPLMKNIDEVVKYAQMAVPLRESVDIAFDRSKTIKLAAELGIPVVDTFMPEDQESVVKVSKQISYPAVVKPRHSCMWVNGRGVKAKTDFVLSEQTLLEKVSQVYQVTGEFPIIQKVIHGDEYGIEMLCENGRIFAISAHQRIRLTTPVGGVSVVKEAMYGTPISTTMRQEAQKILSKIVWSGPIMFEFKEDKEDGKLKLMEINGRFWGSLPLAVLSGVDFPYLYYKYGRGDNMMGEISFTQKASSRHFVGDVRFLWKVLFDKNQLREAFYPTKRKAFKNFILSLVGQKDDVWSSDDKKPFFYEIIDILMKRI